MHSASADAVFPTPSTQIAQVVVANSAATAQQTAKGAVAANSSQAQADRAADNLDMSRVRVVLLCACFQLARCAALGTGPLGCEGLLDRPWR